MSEADENRQPKKEGNEREWPADKLPSWAPRFLDALSEHPNVTRAAEVAEVNRQYAYEVKAANAIFAECWEHALDEAIECLEAETHRRAFDGITEAVWYMGIKVGAVRKYSDTLAIFLLKAHRPERYRERHEVKHGGTVKSVCVFPDCGRDAAKQGADEIDRKFEPE